MAFFINVILLFHRVDLMVSKDSKNGNEDDEIEEIEQIHITGMTLPYFSYEITGWFLAQVYLHFNIIYLTFYFRFCIG